MSITYDIFQGDSSGGPVDYTTVVATTTSLSIALSALGLSTTTRFGVRARDTVSGYSDLNTDAQVMIIVDGSGADVTSRPNAPEALRAIPRVGGTALIEWSYPYFTPKPTGYHVYLGTGGVVDYTTVVATVPYCGVFSRATLTGLADGTLYSVAVRAYSAASEEVNTISVSLLADATGPANVQSLAATLTI